MAKDKTGLGVHDLKVLRSLGEWAAIEAGSARNREKIRAWYAHDAGTADRRVMILAETNNLLEERRPVMDTDVLCTDPWAREVEKQLRLRKFEVDVMQDDHVVSSHIEYAPFVQTSWFGVPMGRRYEAGGAAYSFHYVPPLKELDEADFARLSHRTFTWDRDAEYSHRDRLEAVFTGLMPVRRRSSRWQLVMPLTSTALELVGLDQFMVLMYDNPQGLHRLMAFLRDDMIAFTHFLEDNELFDLNNEADYVGAGSMGYTRTLPADGMNTKVRAKDRWFTVESQESVGLGPRQYAEFVFPYLKELAAMYGRVYYGCCEPADPILDSLRTLPHLSRVSVSPWANEEKMGAFCREMNVAYSRKPTPNIISSPKFDEKAQRDHLAKTVAAARGCRLEIIQRDTYTTCNEPERFVRLVQIAREEAAAHRH